MTIAGLCLIILAGALRTRLGRLRLALMLLASSKALGAAAGRIIDQVAREVRQ